MEGDACEDPLGAWVDGSPPRQRQGMDIKQPDFEDGLSQLYKPASNGEPSSVIPIRYDYTKGGFWVDYIPVVEHYANLT